LLKVVLKHQKSIKNFIRTSFISERYTTGITMHVYYNS
jgi:hypothetical protein